jgi:indole-3-glycerol phosphate synthase
MNFLDKIIPVKQKEVEQLKKRLNQNRFANLFQKPEGEKPRTIFIAEIKPRSPSAGHLIDGDPLALVAAYEQGGADAISVLTDQEFFGGSTDLFRQIRNITDVPLLRKEFIIDEAQIAESFLLGADAVLLIVQIVPPGKLRQLIDFAVTLGLVPLVEVISEAEVEIAVSSGAQYIGINSRNLQTMEVDQKKALELFSKLPASVHSFLFSGIENAQQVHEAIQAGAKGLLIGTSLIKSNDPAKKLRELRAAATKNI